jgi:hypothetical protein
LVFIQAVNEEKKATVLVLISVLEKSIKGDPDFSVANMKISLQIPRQSCRLIPKLR